MKEFSLEFIRNHAIINNGLDVILLDTGSPSTFFRRDEFRFLYKTYKANRNINPFNISLLNKVSKELGMDITTIMGNDILSSYNVLFDYKNERVGFSEKKIKLDGIRDSITQILNVPVVKLELGGEELSFFLDTGTHISYISEEFTQGLEPVEEGIKAFHPEYGNFETSMFCQTAKFHGLEFKACFGNLPERGNVLFSSRFGSLLGNVKGIIGYDFFKAFQIMLSLDKNEIIVK